MPVWFLFSATGRDQDAAIRHQKPAPQRRAHGLGGFRQEIECKQGSFASSLTQSAASDLPPFLLDYQTHT